MFKDEQFYEAKIFLKSYADALNCIKETAEKEAELESYERKMNRIIEAKNHDEIEFKYENMKEGRRFKDLREVKLYNFAHTLFKKYFAGFEGTTDFKDMRYILDSGYEKMKADFKV